MIIILLYIYIIGKLPSLQKSQGLKVFQNRLRDERKKSPKMKMRFGRNWPDVPAALANKLGACDFCPKEYGWKEYVSLSDLVSKFCLVLFHLTSSLSPLSVRWNGRTAASWQSYEIEGDQTPEFLLKWEWPRKATAAASRYDVRNKKFLVKPLRFEGLFDTTARFTLFWLIMQSWTSKTYLISFITFKCFV